MEKLNNKEISPLSSLEQWEDDVLKRYPEPGNIAKTKDEFRNYDNPEVDTVREFYRLNHKYQTYDNVLAKKAHFLKFQQKEMPWWDAMEYLNTWWMSRTQICNSTSFSTYCKRPKQSVQMAILIGLC